MGKKITVIQDPIYIMILREQCLNETSARAYFKPSPTRGPHTRYPVTKRVGFQGYTRINSLVSVYHSTGLLSSTIRELPRHK